jgi:protein ImuA
VQSSAPHSSSFTLPAEVWRADALASGLEQVVPTGVAALDAQLPGGGWPVGALTEILQTPGTHAEWQLLLPALARCGSEAVLLVGAPHTPWVPSLSAQGLAVHRVLWVGVQKITDGLWATEQALRCAGVDAVLAWLPKARADQLRRLQLAAAEFNKLLFVFRAVQSQGESSPAVLRLLLEHGPSQNKVTDSPSDSLSVRLLKRRGPPLEHAIPLPVASPALVRLLAATTLHDAGHALDCTAALA